MPGNIQVSIHSGYSPRSSYRIPGDKASIKALSAIPVIGNVIEEVVVHSLNKTIEHCQIVTNEPQRHALAIDVKKEYKTIAFCRNLVCLASVVTLVAVGVFSAGVVPIALAGFFILLLIRDNYQLRQMNNPRSTWP